VLLGLCTQTDLNNTVLKARRALEKAAAAGKEPAAAAPDGAAKPEEASARRAGLELLGKLLPEQSS
jgi:hypothetical protein